MPNRHLPSNRQRVPWLAGTAFMLAVFGSVASEVPTADIDWVEAQQFWAFQAPQPQPLPSVQDRAWPQRPLDYFILARLERQRLRPSPPAADHVLLRRVTFDLTGLPPSLEEMALFRADTQSGAYERLVDRLLASPRFGERLASVWMNAARYAEDQAHQVGNDTASFYPNAYHYRQWVIDAFNRDLPYNEFIMLQLAADGLPGTLREELPALGFIGLGPKYYNRGRIEVMADEWEDRVDTVTRSFLGLTVACARCHDHKYDPITMADYYGLAGVFASTKLVNKTADGKGEPDKEKKEEKKTKPVDPNLLHVVEDTEPKDLNIFLRGNVDSKGIVVPRRFLRILSPGEPAPFQHGSGRVELAQAIADPHNPLTARVMVNRIWATVFGRPLVGTQGNFGHFGDRPTHPELLDALAVRFMQDGWSIKELVREMVLSATYRQQSRHDGPRSVIDPANHAWWRMERKRLTIEQWRDAVLGVSGTLEYTGGKSLELDDPLNRRRTVFGRVSRLELNNTLMLFDYPDPNVHHSERPVTTTATQKLFVLNSPFMLRETAALAKRLTADGSQSDEQRVTHAYRLLFGRAPKPPELALALRFLAGTDDSEMSRWERYAQVLLASNEMNYVD